MDQKNTKIQATRFEEVEMPVSSGPWDGWLLLCTCALLSIGVVMVFSASSATALWKFNDSAYFLKKQVIFMILGFVALAVGLKIDFRWYRRLVYPILFLPIISLIAVAIFGTSVGGATRWIRLGGFNFQPAELAKLAMVIVLSYSVAKKQDRIKSFSVGLVPHFLIVGIVIALLLLQPDFGTSVIIASLMFVILFVAGTRVSYILSALVLGALIAWQLIASSPYRMKRVMAFIDPWAHRSDIGFQITESLISIGSGGTTGKGLGQGLGKLGFVPELHTDFVGTAVAEEFGFAGICVLALIFVFFLWRGLKISINTPDIFGRYLALGITILITLQAAVNLCVISGLLPTKGLTLPFVSYGGSSMLMSMFAVGVLLNISRYEEDFYEKKRLRAEKLRNEALIEKKRERIMNRLNDINEE